MRIESIQAFVSAAELRSFSKASENLYMSQPTVSRHIRELEKQMGVALFVRNAHTCELTLLGKQVFVHAKRMINEWESIQAFAGNVGNQERVVRIGYTYQEMLSLITPALSDRRFLSRKLELTVRFGGSTELLRLLRENQLDCVVMHLPSVSNPADLEIRRIQKCDMCVHVPESHHFADRDVVTMEELSRETDVRVLNEKGYYKMADEAFRSLNLPLMQHEYVQNVADYIPVACYRNLVYLRPSIYEPWHGCKKVGIQDWTTDFSLVFVTRAEGNTEITEKLYQALCKNAMNI